MRFEGAKLAGIMGRRGISAGELHRQMVRQGCDISRQTIYNWLNGRISYPNQADLAVVAGIFNVSTSYFFDPNPTQHVACTPEARTSASGPSQSAKKGAGASQKGRRR